MATKVRKRIPRTKAHTAAGPSFMDLPAEVRNMIYRLLLVRDQTLGSEDIAHEIAELEWAQFRGYHLQPAILRVCRQLHQEASAILNGENTFGIQIYGREFQINSRYTSESDFEADSSDEWETRVQIFFMNLQPDIGRGMSHFRRRIPSIDKFQRVEIMIDTSNLDLKFLEFDTEKLCSSILCNMFALQHVSLRLLERSYHNPKNNHLALGPFGTLRNMRGVVIQGVPSPFAERLKGLMLGNTPQIDVKMMYFLLERFVHGSGQHSPHCSAWPSSHPGHSLHPGYYSPLGYSAGLPRFSDLKHSSDLQEASKSLQEWDIQKFTEIRSKIVSDIHRDREDALRHLFDFDPKGGERNHATVEGNYDDKLAEKYISKIEDDHDGTLGKDRGL